MKRIFAIIISVMALLGAVSCKEDAPLSDDTKRTILIYAVASNNLSSFLRDDMAEMISAAPAVAGLGSTVRVMVYSVASQSATEATLKELQKNSEGEWEFKTIKNYDRDTYSTDPDRMREVFQDLTSISESDKYGLILWSHGTGWLPNFSDHGKDTGASVPQRSFGLDKNGSTSDYCDIHELAQAIPDGMFDYIWFDLCYMMGIEVCYQLRDKCDYICGYPTEDWSTGMNYDSTLPMLAAPVPDLTGAAESFFSHYNMSGLAVTVTVARTAPLEELAEAAAAVYAAGSRPGSSTGLQNYSRLSKKGQELFDFGQFTERYLQDDPDNPLITRFRAALDKVVEYGACSVASFDGQYGTPFNPEIYSGFSCHFPGTAAVASEAYYSELDWVTATRP
ncbi:MAG: hypothetical protein K2K93_01330 [Muribaculaceae bacterium]|nr:hypothetical protein [Muribaculaceae bacterium]